MENRDIFDEKLKKNSTVKLYHYAFNNIVNYQRKINCFHFFALANRFFIFPDSVEICSIFHPGTPFMMLAFLREREMCYHWNNIFCMSSLILVGSCRKALEVCWKQNRNETFIFISHSRCWKVEQEPIKRLLGFFLSCCFFSFIILLNVCLT